MFMTGNDTKLKLWSFAGNMRILHLTWFAFFLTFFVWFNHAPLLVAIRDTLHLTDQQVKTLLILNVALTIPARIIIGMLVDAFGPRRIYSLLLFSSSFLCFGFAFADTFERLALMRFLLGFVGAGFVIGIRMVGEWFPAKQIGLAEGIYGGWGNFGSAAAALTLPTLAYLYGGAEGWRYAIATTGLLTLIYSIIYFFSVSDTPKGSTYFKPKRSGGMEVSSRQDLILYLVMNIPMYAALATLAWKLGPTQLGMLNNVIVYGIDGLLAGLFIFQTIRIYQINKHVLYSTVPDIDRYAFKQVAILNISYLVAFGSELAVVSMLPLYFTDTFGLSIVLAGLLGGSFAIANLFARPFGGLISDKRGRKKTLLIILFGIMVGYIVMSQINSGWPLALAVLVTVLCSLFVQAGCGAVFAAVPLIKRRLTGQIAGMAGAYGNIGGVLYLTVLSFVAPSVFFLVIAASALLTLIAVAIFFDEPKGHMAEVLPDGTVQMIEVA